MLVLVGIVDVYADINYWYWQYRWLDTPVHFAGGVWVALAAVWLSRVVHKPLRSLLGVVAVVLVVGVGWEVYEYFFTASYSNYYIFDTSKDLLMDILGGLLGYLWAQRIAPQEVVKNTTHE